MIKQYLNVIVAIFTLALVVGCDYDEETFEPNFVTFEDSSIALSVQENSSTSREVSIYTGNTQGSARTYNIVVGDGTTLSESVYSVPSSVTVPANSNEVTFTIDLADDGLPNAGGTLVLMLEETGNYSTGENLTLAVSKVCPFDVNRFTGDFRASEVFTAGGNSGFSFLDGAEFPVSLSVNPDDASGNSLVLNDPNGIIADGTVLSFDAAGNFSIPDATVINTYPLAFTGSTTDTCNEKLTITGNLNGSAESAGFGEYTVTLVR